MIKKSIIKEIDKAVKEIWLDNILTDYCNDYLLKEDSLKNAMYYHIRQRLDPMLMENDLRIYTEYYLNINGEKYFADIAIVRIDTKKDYDWLGNAVTDVLAVFELKYKATGDSNTDTEIRRDLTKFREYFREGGLSECQFYFAVIYENERMRTNWLDGRSINNWADGRVTELDACYQDGEIVFEVNSYNGLNNNL